MRKTSNQDGFVAIIIAMVVMIIVSLLALGFAYLVRQNQIQSQNRTLSTQAFYAAESGVNDAIDYLKKGIAAGTPRANITSCADNSLATNNYKNVPSGSQANVSYTCVLLNSSPQTLERPLSTDTSTVLRVEADGGAPLQSITISWHDTAGNTQFPNDGSHPLPEKSYSSANPSNVNNLRSSTGIVRATLIPIFSPITRDALTNDAQTVFLYPLAASPPSAPGSQKFLTTNADNAAGQDVFINGNCTAAPTNAKADYCSATITDLYSLGNTSVFYLRLKAIYRTSTVKISARTIAGPANLINAQAVVDATGKASNVVRRIQVRVPLQQAGVRPEFAVESTGSICKRFGVYAGGTGPGDPGVVPIPLADGSFPAICQP